ncbi:MAG: tol-pal system YbgF family protein [Candidatus Obscuribacterales bacterium]
MRPLKLALLLVLLSHAPCLAAGEAAYKAGVTAYQKKDYKTALEQFRQSVKSGNKEAAVWIYCAHAYLALGHKDQAAKTYQRVIDNFGGTPEADIAAKGLEAINAAPAAPAGAPETAPAEKSKPGAAAPAAGEPVGLAARISVTPPRMGHPPVSEATMKAVREAVEALPAGMRKALDDSDAAISVSPNMIDKWPESINDLDETSPTLNLAENRGRIYGKEMNMYERPKVRGSRNLGAARSPRLMKHTVFNQSFQIVDDMWTISKDPKLRHEYFLDKKNVPFSAQTKLATFLKDDDWGPRETCAELVAGMLGGGDENTADLYRYFPKTKAWLKQRLGIR